jgi:hypothetical protein
MKLPTLVKRNREKAMSSLALSLILPTSGFGADAFVIPDIETLVVKPLKFRIDEFAILVGIAHKDIRLITLVRRERSIH